MGAEDPWPMAGVQTFFSTPLTNCFARCTKPREVAQRDHAPPLSAPATLRSGPDPAATSGGWPSCASCRARAPRSRTCLPPATQANIEKPEGPHETREAAGMIHCWETDVADSSKGGRQCCCIDAGSPPPSAQLPSTTHRLTLYPCPARNDTAFSRRGHLRQSVQNALPCVSRDMRSDLAAQREADAARADSRELIGLTHLVASFSLST